MSRVYFGAGLVTGTAALVLSPYTVRRVEGDSMRPTFNPEENISNGRYMILRPSEKGVSCTLSKTIFMPPKVYLRRGTRTQGTK